MSDTNIAQYYVGVVVSIAIAGIFVPATLVLGLIEWYAHRVEGSPAYKMERYDNSLTAGFMRFNERIVKGAVVLIIALLIIGFFGVLLL